MFDKIEKMRNESPEKKKLVAFSIALLFTGIIFVVWLSVWMPNFFRKNKDEQKKDFNSPISNLVNDLGNSLGFIKSQADEMKNYLQNIR